MKKILLGGLIISTGFLLCNAQNLSNTERKFNIEKFKQCLNPATKLCVYDTKNGGKVIESSSNNGYIRKIQKDNNSIYNYYEFYSDGTLKATGQNFARNFPLGIRYEYDNNGILVNTINFEDSFAFSWSDLVKYCYKNGININDVYTYIKRSKDDSDNSCYWRVSYSGEHNNEKGFFDVLIDGKTGEEIKSSFKKENSNTLTIIYEKFSF